MAKEERKSVALEIDTYSRLSKLAADLRSANPGGGFVSMSVAVRVLLDKWEETTNEPKGMTLLDLLEATKKLEGLNEIEAAILDEAIAQAQSVIIKQSDGALYLQKTSSNFASFVMTHYKEDAMIFESFNEAKAFLRKCHRPAGDWIIEPV